MENTETKKVMNLDELEALEKSFFSDSREKEFKSKGLFKQALSSNVKDNLCLSMFDLYLKQIKDAIFIDNFELLFDCWLVDITDKAKFKIWREKISNELMLDADGGLEDNKGKEKLEKITGIKIIDSVHTEKALLNLSLLKSFNKSDYKLFIDKNSYALNIAVRSYDKALTCFLASFDIQDKKNESE